MATKYECDRCGSQFDKSDKIYRLDYKEPNRYKSYSEDDVESKSKDLCQACTNQLIEWLKPLAKPAPTLTK